MKKIFFLSCHNNPSGGTKVLNQVVNLFIEKGYESYLVTSEKNSTKATFLKNPCPITNLESFNNKCDENDIVIACWQHKTVHEAVKKCPAKMKIFWQHGIIVPKYKNFNGEEIFKKGVYNQYWNVSKACADYIKNKYKLEDVKIVHPFFNDKTLLEYLDKKDDSKKEGVLILQRRGKEAIPDIISLIPNQKITIFKKTFSDEDLYSKLIKHKFFISTDNGINSTFLIKNKFRRKLKQLRRKLNNIFKKPKEDKNKWIKHDKNLLGFPVTACEAAWLGTNVIAFAMGGGLEWMNNDNIYLAKDGDINSLLEKTKEAVEDSEENLKKKKKLAFENVKKFNKENTWKQLTNFLNI